MTKPEETQEEATEPTVEDLQAIIDEQTAKLAEQDTRLAELDKAHGRSKSERTEAKERLKTFEALGSDPDDIQKKLDRLAELEIASNPDDAERQAEFLKLQIKRETQPIRTELESVVRERDEAQATLRKMLERERESMVRGIGTEWIAENVHPDAQAHAKLAIGHLLTMDDDNNVVSRDFEGIAAGLPAAEALEKLKAKYPTWGLESVGSGSGRSSGRGPKVSVASENVFLEKRFGGGWNMTQQHRLLANDPEKAKAMKSAAAKAREKAKAGVGQ